MTRRRKIPLRKCVITKETKPKQEMIRIVRNKTLEVFVDPTGKMNGRGAYLTIDKAVIAKAKQDKTLEKVFNVTIDDSIYDQLEEIAITNEQEK